MSTPAVDITSAGNAFYEAEPFNLTQAPKEAARLIRTANPIARMYPALGVTDRVIFRHANLFELPASGIPTERRFPVVNSLGVLQRVDAWSTVFATERELGAVSHRKNVVEQQYYPGFFVVLAQRPRA